MRRAPLLATTLAGLALVPAGAARAARPQPLVDVAPTSTAFADRVLAGAAPRAADASPPIAYATPDGQSVRVSFSAGYAPDPAVAQTYVGFLGSLPHGAELSQLSVSIATPAEVQAACGGVDGTLACYSEATHTMTVPGQQLDASSGGVTTSYVIAHEYGHHVAAFRNNAPFDALDYGPKYWASYKQVCLGALERAYHPGDESRHYLDNPGEAWAETYAHLVYPTVPWRFAAALAPDAGALAAARRDVATPWTANLARTFTGTFTRGSSNARHFRYTLTLDGSMSVRLKGPAGTDYDLALVSRGRTQRRTTARGSSDRITYPDGACREAPRETITLSVSRKRGNGPFSVRVSYAG
jgi:hypothetical protein